MMWGENRRDGLQLNTRWQAIAPVTPSAKAGLELFNSWGHLNDMNGYARQTHQLGPVLKGRWDEHISYQLGYLQGISRNAPDQAVKFFLTYTF